MAEKLIPKRLEWGSPLRGVAERLMMSENRQHIELAGVYCEKGRQQIELTGVYCEKGSVGIAHGKSMRLLVT